MTAHNLYGGYSASDKDFGSSAAGINKLGVIAGRAGVRWESDVWGPSYNHVPATTTGGGWSEIPMPNTANTKYGGNAGAINDAGVILGTGGPGGDRAWLSSGGLPGPQYELLAGAHGLNNLGHIAGRTVGTTTAFTARVWDGGQYVEIGAQQPKSKATVSRSIRRWVSPPASPMPCRNRASVLRRVARPACSSLSGQKRSTSLSRRCVPPSTSR